MLREGARLCSCSKYLRVNYFEANFWSRQFSVIQQSSAVSNCAVGNLNANIFFRRAPPPPSSASPLLSLLFPSSRKTIVTTTSVGTPAATSTGSCSTKPSLLLSFLPSSLRSPFNFSRTVFSRLHNVTPLHHQRCQYSKKARNKRHHKQKALLSEKRKLLGKRYRKPGVLKVLSTGSYNSCKSFNIRAGNQVYLFNCGDNTMRRCFESRTMWADIRHLFITHKSYKNMCGIVEMALNLAKPPVGDAVTVSLHGSGDLNYMATPAARTIVEAISLDVNMHPIDEPYEDDALRVQYIQLRDVTRPDDDDSAACAFKINIYASEPSVDFRKLIKYCVKLGDWITPLVKHGETVEINGRTITPHMVLSEREKDDTVLVMDCPTVNHLPSLSAHTETLNKTNGGDFIDLVVHMTPHHITEHEVYQEFMTSFPASTQHIVLSEQVDATSLRTAWEQQVHYNHVDKDIFPILHPKPVGKVEQESRGNVLLAKPGLSYTLNKREWLFTGRNSKPLTVEAAMSYFNVDSAHIDRVMEKINERVSLTDQADCREYPVVSMLGTAASKPTSTRNTSGILVETSKDKYSLLDCGNGILGQITHLYGPERTNHILRNLNMIFVSHKHLDHHAGLLALFNARQEAFGGENPSKLHFVFPQELRQWYLHLHRIFGGLQGVRLLTCSQMRCNRDDVYHHNPSNVQLLRDTGLSSLSIFRVKHIPGTSCYGISLNCNGYKLVYSGDTMPCEQLVRAAMNADLLIHEATFGDAFWKDAQRKKHCTVSQALEVAKRCQAKFTLLTHFSSRHHRVPPYSQQLMESSNVGVAFDNMVLKPKDLPNTTFAVLWNIIATMHPQYTALSKKTDIGRTIVYQRLDRMDPEEILKTVNKLGMGKG